MNKTWDQENNEAIYQTSLAYLKKINDIDDIYGLELYITAGCNQKCEYCYLNKFEDKLYPKECNKPDIILNNLSIFLQYLIDNQIYPYKIDIFSGEILHTNLGISVLDQLLKYYSQIPLNENQPPKQLIIPTNFTFILYDEYRVKIENFIKDFHLYNVDIVLSCSYDGPIVEEENRPFKNLNSTIKTKNEYIDFLFKWCKKYGFGFHPMVNSYNIEKWPEQYRWWLFTIKSYDMDLIDNTMFLEVRNDEWTDNKIISFLKYLNSGVDDVIHYYYQDDFNRFIDHVFCINKVTDKPTNYFQFGLGFQGKGRGCSIDREYCIRLGDLAWVPCHRTSYEKLVYGKYILENNKIVGMKANNIPLMVSINSLGYKGILKCDDCAINKLCVRGCFGAQFESNKEVFYPCESVCNLYKAKIIFLFEKYKKIYFENNNMHPTEDQLDMYNRVKTDLANLNKEDLNKWMPIVQQLLVN